MNDRELLEFAAKAAGVDVIGWTLDKHGVGVLATQDGFFQPLLSNTLADCDGDALRLVVKLGLTLDVCPAAQPAEVRCTPYTKDYWDELDRCDEPLTSNHYAATRRAIVRAAAEIGKEMK